MLTIGFVCHSNGYAQNTPPVITKLKVIETQQGEQGVKQLIVRAVATDKEDGNNVSYEYTITKGNARLEPVKRYAILHLVDNDTVQIELKVFDKLGSSTIKAIDYINEDIDSSKIYSDKTEWLKAIGRNFRKHASFKFQVNDSILPNVLLIGNSISIGYTPYVQEILKGKCNVYRIPGNGGDTQKGIDNFKYWISSMNWDVVHFNFGLHDLKYIKDNKLDISGEQQIVPEIYKSNLKEIVRQLKLTNAKLIWATTSVVPEGAEGRKKGDEVKYNAIALEIMQANQIPIDDQYALTQKYPDDQRPNNVHFYDEGKERQANQVANQVLQVLK